MADLFDRFPKEGDSLKEAIGGAMIDKIRERAKSGNFLEQSRGAQRYSNEYADSFEFKVFGKSKSNVNMTASGDMLRDINITRQTKNAIELGFDSKAEAEKAHGHITGAVGKVRDFFGITDSDIEEIRKEFGVEVKNQLKLESGSITTAEVREPGEDLFGFLRRVIGSRGVS